MHVSIWCATSRVGPKHDQPGSLRDPENPDVSGILHCQFPSCLLHLHTRDSSIVLSAQWCGEHAQLSTLANATTGETKPYMHSNCTMWACSLLLCCPRRCGDSLVTAPPAKEQQMKRRGCYIYIGEVDASPAASAGYAVQSHRHRSYHRFIDKTRQRFTAASHFGRTP